MANLIAVLLLIFSIQSQSVLSVGWFSGGHPLDSQWYYKSENLTMTRVTTDNIATPRKIVFYFKSDGCWKIRLYDSGNVLHRTWEDPNCTPRVYLPIVGR